MPGSSSRSARVAMSDHPRPQRIGLRRLLIIAPAFLVEPDLRRFDEPGAADVRRGVACEILSTANDHVGIDAALDRRLEFQARGLLWVIVRFPRRVVPPEGFKPIGAFV